jgi:hypothetical protein
LTGNGQYADLSACLIGCTPTTGVSFDCGTLGCYDPGTGNGAYSTFALCDADCNQIYGCTQSLACNYDPNATTDDGSCLGWNYASETVEYVGCTDPTACNYDAAANCDDGSCEFTSCLDGCTDPLYQEYDPLAINNDGSCISLHVLGCTDPTSCSYDPLATKDDGTCLTIYGCMDPTDPNYDPNAQCNRDADCANCPVPEEEPTSWDCINGTCGEIVGEAGYASESACIEAGPCETTPEPSDSHWRCISGGCYELFGTNPGGVDDYNNYTECINNCSAVPQGVILGCTQQVNANGVTASNYDPLATIDDGSCLFFGEDPCTNLISGLEACADFNCLIQNAGQAQTYCSGQNFASAYDLAAYWATEINNAQLGFGNQGAAGGYVDIGTGAVIGPVTTQEMYDMFIICCDSSNQGNDNSGTLPSIIR